MANPFDNEDGLFLILTNLNNQHTLWPSRIAVPAGWTVVHGPDARSRCMDYVESNWTDMRPARHVAAMDRAASASTSATTERSAR